MGERFTIELPQERVNTFREIARLAYEPIESVIAEILIIKMRQIETADPRHTLLEDISTFSTIYLWSIVQFEFGFPAELDKQMQSLLEKSQNSGEISTSEYIELENLYDRYDYSKQLRANVLAELKRRGEHIERTSS